MTTLTGHRVDLNRWYTVEILPSLFGGFVVVQTWGAEGKVPSGTKRRLCSDFDAAQAVVGGIVKRKPKYFKVGGSQ